MIRAFLVVLGFGLFFVLFFPVLLILLLLRKIKPEWSSKAAFYIIRTFLKFELFLAGTKVIAEGLENIPENETVLFIGNHRSDFDVLAVYSKMKRPIGFVAKHTLHSIPIMGQWMVVIDSIFMDRFNARAGLAAIKEAIAKVNSGVSVFIFPEGTRNRNADQDEPMEFKEGSLKIAQKAGCRVVPVAIKDTEKIFEVHKPKARITAETVRVRFLPPIDLKADIPEEYKKTPNAYIRELIMEANREPITKN